MEDAKKYIYYIYKLCYEDKQNNLSYCYIGSTNDINTRHKKHETALNNSNDKQYNKILYETIRKYPNLFEMIVIHKTTEPVTSIEAHILEEQYRVNLNANLNINRCYCSSEERKQDKKAHSKQRYLDNKQEILTDYKKYYENNKTQIQEYKKNYHIENRERLNAKSTKYQEDNRAEQLLKRKAYREANKEKIAEQKRAYYQKNKATYNDYKKIEII